MANDSFFDDDVRDSRISRRRNARTGEAVSRLCSSWFRAGADILVGALGIAEHVSEDLTETYCDRKPRRRD